MDIDLILDPAVLVALGAILGVLTQFALKTLEARYQAARGVREDAAKIVEQRQESSDRADERELSSIKSAAEMLRDWASKLLAAYDASQERLEKAYELIVGLRQEIAVLRWQVSELTFQLTQATGIKVRPMPELPVTLELKSEPTKTVEEKREAAIGPVPDVDALVNVLANGAKKKEGG